MAGSIALTSRVLWPACHAPGNTRVNSPAKVVTGPLRRCTYLEGRFASQADARAWPL